MGQFRFLIPRDDPLPATALAKAYLSGMEGIPWQSANHQVTTEAGDVEFILERNTDESGNLFMPWQTESHGELMLSTASLMEMDTPYTLPLEIARGVLNRLRNQAFDWEIAGLVISPEVRSKIDTASATFIQAVTSVPDDSRVAEQSGEAIRWSLAATESLSADYTRQALAARHQGTERLPTLLGSELGTDNLSDQQTSLLTSSFNTAGVSFAWRAVEQTAGKHEWDVFDQQIDWCRANGMTVIGGPLMQFDAAHVPDWIYLWEDDFDQIQAYLTQYIRETVTRYRGRVDVWNCAARMNITGAITLSEEQRLRLMVSSIEELRRCDPQRAVILSFDQPWGEYIARNARDPSPLHFADSLVRAGLGIAGVGIELNVGYSPGGSFPRTVLDYSQKLDRWSILGLPLVVFLTVPSDCSEVPGAMYVVEESGTAWTPAAQSELLDRLVPLILAKQYVQGIIWNQFTDEGAQEFAHGGLIDAQGVPKPALESLSSIRKLHLK